MAADMMLLLDADGVIQTFDDGWLTGLRALVSEADAQAFLRDVFETEKPSLTGGEDFAKSARQLLDRWHIKEPVADFLFRWNAINTNKAIFKLIRQVRASGALVCLGSNQQHYRASYMRSALKYDDHFDHLFFSCAMAFAKPDPQFFRLVHQQLKLKPKDILFVDDSKANVESARSIGMIAETFDLEAGVENLKLIIGANMDVDWRHE